MPSLPYIDADAVRSALPWEVAIGGIEAALRLDVDPEADGPRIFAPNPTGEFLIMPASTPSTMGVKVLTIAPDNPAHGLEKIQGTYLLFDARTSAPICAMDGTALTSIRTPAVTLTGLRALAAAAPAGHEMPRAPKVVVFGAGVQAIQHVRAARWAWPEARFQVVGRRSHRVRALVDDLAGEGVAVDDATADPETAVRTADVVITVTTSRTPVLPGAWVRENALVATVGQHGLDAREVDADLVLRSDVLLESRAGMFREGGAIIPARSVEQWRALHPANLRDGVRGELERTPGRPALFAGVGMAWEDLVLAQVVHRAFGW
ncbi:ornithine cyclodeaminase family protein [Aeromicrobium sp. CTD01-1L150]|uniref:ornithine cyclodeaminase family protein n=1 Tax=Aeromicrobium sp. CTD01-1L150 TaxID=3341830 RepID=UPI0035C02905